MASHKFTAILHVEMEAEDGSFGDSSDYQKELVQEYVTGIAAELNQKYMGVAKVSMPKGAVQEMLDIDAD